MTHIVKVRPPWYHKLFWAMMLTILMLATALVVDEKLMWDQVYRLDRDLRKSLENLHRATTEASDIATQGHKLALAPFTCLKVGKYGCEVLQCQKGTLCSTLGSPVIYPATPEKAAIPSTKEWCDPAKYQTCIDREYDFQLKHGWGSIIVYSDGRTEYRAEPLHKAARHAHRRCPFFYIALPEPQPITSLPLPEGGTN